MTGPGRNAGVLFLFLYKIRRGKNSCSVVHKWDTKRKNRVKIVLGHSDKDVKKSIYKGFGL